ncbi:hypothetical protein CFREI_01110 [Corynebacterium freiburgense]|nr:hypothetical protein CFREI_01110 [Corynebacterium freiburgense]
MRRNRFHTGALDAGRCEMLCGKALSRQPVGHHYVYMGHRILSHFFQLARASAVRYHRMGIYQVTAQTTASFPTPHIPATLKPQTARDAASKSRVCGDKLLMNPYLTSFFTPYCPQLVYLATKVSDFTLENVAFYTNRTQDGVFGDKPQVTNCTPFIDFRRHFRHRRHFRQVTYRTAPKNEHRKS